MLSYRHYFHAGNHADVLKHVLLVQMLRYLTRKDKPLCYLDTHAGAGKYPLLKKQPQNREPEFHTGIGRLWDHKDLPEAVADYVELVREFNDTGKLCYYPGSPWFAGHLLRSSDRLFLYELHSTDVEMLRENTGSDKRVRVLEEDGFAGCIANMPPVQRRGLVLMDPAYEIKTDYQKVVDTLVKAYKRFPAGVFAIWYPVVERHRIDRMEKAVVQSGIRNVRLFELGIEADHVHRGMTGSGMIIVNSPWNLEEKMQQALPYLSRVLGKEGAGSHRIEVLVPE